MKLCKILLLATMLTAGAPLSAASADEGPGTLTLESADEVSASEVRYVVRLTYIGDGHPARDATVTATAIDAEGSAQTPIPMTVADQDGRYEGTIAFPSSGEWTVRFTAVLPPATLDQLQTIAAPATTTTSKPATTTTTVASGPIDNEATSADGDGGGLPWFVYPLALFGVVYAGTRFVARRDRS